MTFTEELTKLINRYYLENESNTPDFILANYLRLSLEAFNVTTNSRSEWYGQPKAKPTIMELEKILNSSDPVPITYLPNGQIVADKEK